MNTVYLLLIILGVSAQDFTKKLYTKRNNNHGKYIFSALSSLFAMLFFIITSKDIKWNVQLLPFSLAFAVSFFIACLFNILSIATGSLSLTSLINSYSLILPTLYGLIFLKDSVSLFFPPGILLIVISLFLINKTNDKHPFSPKWIIFVFLAFIGNGMCSVFQKIQQVKFEGFYKNEFMIIALAIVTIVFGILSIYYEKAQFKNVVCHSGFLASLCGVFIGAVNLFVMILSGRMAVSIMFPMISAGGILVTSLISVLIYKESLSKMQLAGLISGTVSIIFLSI